jgi:hypothetical protein
MANSTFLLSMTGVVPAVCDSEAGEAGQYEPVPQDRRPEPHARKPVQLLAKIFKNRTAVSPKLIASTIHQLRGSSI